MGSYRRRHTNRSHAMCPNFTFALLRLISFSLSASYNNAMRVEP
jgi:hypothetical protein